MQNLEKMSRQELESLLQSTESHILSLQAQITATAPEAPELLDLQAQLEEAQNLESLLEDEIIIDDAVQSLGDVALKIEQYYNSVPYEKDGADSFNIAGFTREHIRTSFGWEFKNLPKPTLAQLLAL